MPQFGMLPLLKPEKERLTCFVVELVAAARTLLVAFAVSAIGDH